MHTTFSNTDDHRQAYPDTFPGGDHPPRTGAAEINTLYGFDTVYRLRFTFAHSGNSLVLNFAGIGLQEIGDESWGLDTVRVSVAGTPILVTATQDSGPGSLRQALLDANAAEEQFSVIAFNIPHTDAGFDGHVFTLQPNHPNAGRATAHVYRRHEPDRL